MSKQRYGWDRYWVPRDGRYRVDSSGFFQPPVDDLLLKSFYASDAVGFESIAHIPCLGLLGEPGIGKSARLSSGTIRVNSLVLDATLLSRPAKKAKPKVAKSSPTKGKSGISGGTLGTAKNRQRSRARKSQRKAAKPKQRKK